MCDWCGKERRISPSARRPHNFCDRKCCRAWQGANEMVAKPQRIEVPCFTCGKLMSRQRNQIERVAESFCSRKCFAEAHRARMGGDRNPAWRGGFDPYYGPTWKETAAKVRERDGNRCVRCGAESKRGGRALEVHHKRPLREFRRDFAAANHPDNLVTLCGSCHRSVEWRENLSVPHSNRPL